MDSYGSVYTISTGVAGGAEEELTPGAWHLVLTSDIWCQAPGVTSVSKEAKEHLAEAENLKNKFRIHPTPTSEKYLGELKTLLQSF